ARTMVRLAMPERIDRELADRIHDELREFAHLGGFVLRPDSTPWFGAALGAPEDARAACDLAVRLSTRLLPLLIHRVGQVSEETGLAAPAGYTDCVERLALFDRVRQTLRVLTPGVYAADPGRLATAVGDGGGLGLRERRALRKQATGLVTAGTELSREDLAAALTQAAAQLADWQSART